VLIDKFPVSAEAVGRGVGALLPRMRRSAPARARCVEAPRECNNPQA